MTLIFNSTKVPGIDRKYFLGALGMGATRSRAFPRSFSSTNLEIHQKTRGWQQIRYCALPTK